MARQEDCLRARALEGEERPIVSAGKLLGTWRHFDNRLAMFLLRQRRPARSNAEGTHFANLREGHPVYERLRAEWEREHTVRRHAAEMEYKPLD